MGTSVNSTESRSLLLRQQQDGLRQEASSNQAAVQQNSADQQSNGQAVQTNSQAQQGNASDIQTTTGNIQTTTQGIDAANTKKSGVNTEISNLRAQLQSVQDDPDRASAIQDDISAAQLSLSELDAEIQQLGTQKAQQEQELSGLEQTGTQLRTEGQTLEQEGASLQQTGTELAQKGTDLETQIADLDTQIAQAEAEEAEAARMAEDAAWDENQKKIDNLGDKLVEEGTTVVEKSFKPGTTAQDVAEQSVSDYLVTMLHSDMFTDEDKQAFRDQLASTLQNPKSLKALKKGDMETLMKDPAIKNLVNEKKSQIETLNLNNKEFKNGKIDVPVTAGEQDVSEMKEQYTSFMYKLMRAADGNTEYYKAGLESNSGEVDMYAPTLRGFNKEIVGDLEAANKGMHQSMRDVILEQDADKFVNYLNKVNGKNFHVSTSDIAQLFKDYSNNPQDPTINARLIKYCGYEASANRLNNDIESAEFSKNVGMFLLDTGTLVAPGVGELVGVGFKGGTKLVSSTAKFAKYSNTLAKAGKWGSRIGKGADHVYDTYDLFTKFRSVYNSSKK